MFIGHFGAAFAAKRVSTRPSLGTYLIAACAMDLLFPVLLLLGVERAEIVPGETAVMPLRLSHYPFSHSLASGVIGALLLGGAYGLWRKDRRAGFAIGLAVFSHFVLDFISHEPDLPLAPGLTTRIGLGLWNSFLGTIIVEGAIFALGVALYVNTTRPRDKTGRYSLAALVTFLVLLYIASLGGEPPPNIKAFAAAGLSSWLLIFWGYWIDRHRTANSGG